jgi:hypothetical protein
MVNIPNNSEIKKDKKLLDLVRDAVQVRHYSIRTERAYVNWVKQFVIFHNMAHPTNMGKAEIEKFLTWLAVEKVSAPVLRTRL